jgi:DNA polymerase-1
LALLQYEVGSDGRARCPFFPGSTATGRNAPKASRFIFGAPKLFLNLAAARPGYVIVALDYRAEESGVVGALAVATLGLATGGMLETYNAEDDVHLGAAKRAGLVPPDATPQSHKRERKAFKACNLGVVYGARVPRIAVQSGTSLGQAQHFYDLHRALFPEVHEYCERGIEGARESRSQVLQDGWRKRICPPFRPTVAANFPVQGVAAGILRRAVLGVYEAFLPLIATVHDSLVFECRIEEAGDLIATVIRIMGDASEWFFPGFRLKVDVSASLPLPYLSHLNIGHFADPSTREVYDHYLARAAKARRAA